ncbi:MAG: YgiT-type zinc finger protein [Phycisphaerae bacterium]
MTRPTFKTCPTCGSRKIKLTEGNYTTTCRGNRIVVRNVRRHECPTCGEVLLDFEAMEQIEAARLGKRSTSKVSAGHRAVKRGA